LLPGFVHRGSLDIASGGVAIFLYFLQPFRYLRKGDLGLALVALHTSVAVGYADSYGGEW
jgi:hypothetical protein